MAAGISSRAIRGFCLAGQTVRQAAAYEGLGGVLFEGRRWGVNGCEQGGAERARVRGSLEQIAAHLEATDHTRALSSSAGC